MCLDCCNTIMYLTVQNVCGHVFYDIPRGMWKPLIHTGEWGFQWHTWNICLCLAIIDILLTLYECKVKMLVFDCIFQGAFSSFLFTCFLTEFSWGPLTCIKEKLRPPTFPMRTHTPKIIGIHLKSIFFLDFFLSSKTIRISFNMQIWYPQCGQSLEDPLWSLAPT